MKIQAIAPTCGPNDGLYRSPIQHPQARDAREFDGVARYEGGAAADGGSGDQHIEGPDGGTLLFECGADAGGGHGRGGIEGYVTDVGKARLQLTAATCGQLRPQRSILQLVDDDGGDGELARRGFVDARDDRRIALEVVDDDVGVEEDQSRLSRGTSLP